MARAKKASRRSYRRFGYKRTYRRRRYRRKYTKRSGKRFPKGTEVKSKSKMVSSTLMPTSTVENTISYSPGYAFILGGADASDYMMSIPLGTGQGERVGAKIEPIKLRVSGSMSLENSGDIVGNDTYSPNFWQVRCLVYQIKGGNAAQAPDNENYHQLAMVSSTDDGWLTPKQMRKLLMQYFNDGPVADDLNRFTNTCWNRNNNLAKLPLRRGIGGLCRVLYKKSFWINAQKNPVKQFRFITRTPKRFVYPESMARDDGVVPETNCNNSVYIVWMFQPGSFKLNAIPKLNLTFTVDLFYTDK